MLESSKYLKNSLSHFWTWNLKLKDLKNTLPHLSVENNKIRGEIAHSIAHSKTRDHTSMWTMLGEDSNSPPTLLFIPFPIPPHWKPYGITISLPPYSNMLVVLTYLNSTYVFDYLQHLSTTLFLISITLLSMFHLHQDLQHMFARASSVHQKCSNCALTNLLFGLCRFMWIIDLLVIHHNPHPKALECPFYPQSVTS
jgi:hypothetical protein